MLEMIINPKKAEKRPWEMFFVGLLYGALSLLLVHFLFSGDPTLSGASGMIVIAFCIMFTLPFIYYIFKIEEEEDEEVEGVFSVWNAHKDAIYSFMYLFLGFVLAFSMVHIVLQDNNLLNFQLQTYCQINNPQDVSGCVASNSLTGVVATGNVTKSGLFLSILENNILVSILTLLFSLVFGAGAIFILAWNASVIAAAMGVFTKYELSQIPLAFGRYMIHGVPEIAAYFITALAGGIFGVGAIRHGFRSKNFLRVVENSVLLVFMAIIILVIAAIIEVYITPAIF